MRRPVRVGVISRTLLIGGAEMWLSQLMEFCDPDVIKWNFVGVYYGEHVSDVMAGVFGERCPVISVDRIAQACEECDVVIVWGIRLEEIVRPHPRPFKVVLASLGMCDFTRNVMESSDLADGVVAVSQVSMDVIPANHRRRARIIPTAVDLSRTVPKRSVADVRKRWDLADGDKALVFLGRIAPEKNPLAVARTIAALHRMGRTEWRGVLVGPGTPPKYVAVAYIDDTIGLSEDMAPGLMRFIGFANDIGSVYAAADHMIVPSLVEGGSLSLLEMWAAGKPVLATPVGMVAHEHPDLVRKIPVRAKGQEMAAALVADLEDPEGTRARVEKAQRIAREQYSGEILGQRWTQYLLELAARP